MVVRFKGPEVQVDRSCHGCLSGCVSEPENICLEASNTERNSWVKIMAVERQLKKKGGVA